MIIILNPRYSSMARIELAVRTGVNLLSWSHSSCLTMSHPSRSWGTSITPFWQPRLWRLLGDEDEDGCQVRRGGNVQRGDGETDEKHSKKETKLQNGLQKAELQSMRVLQNNRSWGSLYTGQKTDWGEAQSMFTSLPIREEQNAPGIKWATQDWKTWTKTLPSLPRIWNFPIWNSRHQHLWALGPVQAVNFPTWPESQVSQMSHGKTHLKTRVIRSSSQPDRQAGCEKGKFVSHDT